MNEIGTLVFSVNEIGKSCLNNCTASDILAAENNMIANMKREEIEKGGK